MLVPLPVLGELQSLADSADDTKRARGRRGLQVLETLRREPSIGTPAGVSAARPWSG